MKKSIKSPTNPSATTQDRIDWLIRHITKGHSPENRELFSCLEMGDGDAVYAGVWKRAEQQPNSRLAHNIRRYLVPRQS